LTAVLAAGIPHAAGIAGTPSEIHLANGLGVILEEIPASQVVCVSLFAQAGPIQETEANQGISRLLEKSLFRRTRRHPDVRTEISSYGGEYMSGLNQDFLSFSVTSESAFADSIIAIFEDVMVNSQFNDSLIADVQREMLPKMAEEQNNPRVQMLSLFLKNAFTTHPYRLLPYGSIGTFRSLKSGDVERYYRRCFIPQNLVLVITGRFNGKAVVGSLAVSLKPFNRTAPFPFKWDQEPPRRKPVVVVRTHDFPQPLAFVTVGWIAPSIQSRDTYAMDVVLEALGTGESSRLNREIRSSMPSVYSVWAEYRTPREPGYFTVMAICGPSVADTVRGRILNEIGILRDDSLTPKELTRAKQMLAAVDAYSREGATDLGFYLGYWSTMAELDFSQKYQKNIQSVRAEDVQNTVRAYLRDDNCVSVILLPKQSR
jgi:zinc protease